MSDALEIDESSVFVKSRFRPRSAGWQAARTTSMFRRTAKTLKKILGVKVTVYNREAIPAKGPVVIVLNHESYLDPILLGAATPRNGAIMAKHDLWRTPVAPLLILRGDIAVVRHKKNKRNEAKLKGKNILAHEELLALYGGGRLQKLGESDNWFPGFAEMALEFNATIVVGRSNGTAQMLPMAQDRKKYGMKFFNRKVPLELIFSDPITPEDYQGMTVMEITDMCHGINKNLALPFCIC